MKNKGITLVALVVSIIIMLILAGVTLNIALGENGLFKMTQQAVRSYDTASEKETLSLSVVNYNISKDEADKLGEKLSKMSAITGDWKSVIVGEKTYTDGWYLVEKGDKIDGYGEAKSNWIINYDTGEVIELQEGEFTIASTNASGAIVDTSLKLNIDPVNLQDQSKWGTGVSFISGTQNSESGVKKTEIKFDGVDDYLKIENANVEKSGGLTFEFYGKVYENVNTNFLGRNKFDKIGNIKLEITNFRIISNANNAFRINIGSGDCESDLSESFFNDDGRNSHWMLFNKVRVIPQEINYISFSVNFENCEIKVYQDGEVKQITTCSKKYLEGGDAFNNEIPFVIGMLAQGTPVKAVFSKFDLYACRLYTRVLTDTEINQNYVATTNYHNGLVK